MKLLYDWTEYPEIMKFLKKIYFNSVTALEIQKKDKKYAGEFINDIEEYFMYLKEYNFDLRKTLNKINDLLFINFINSHPRIDNNIVYLNQESVTVGDKYISLNENICGDERLTARERRKLYLFKGLSQCLFNYNNARTKEFGEVFKEDDAKTLMVNNGWHLISNTLAQELAERITYYVTGKSRPNNRVGVEEQDYFPINGSLVSSCLEQERPFEELIIGFGATLSGVGSIMDYSCGTVKKDLVVKAIDKDLSDLIISEYVYKGNGQKLYDILYLMGLLMNEKKATYGKRISKRYILNQAEISEIYNTIINSCGELFTFDEDIYEGIPLNNIVSFNR